MARTWAKKSANQRAAEVIHRAVDIEPKSKSATELLEELGADPQLMWVTLARKALTIEDKKTEMIGGLEHALPADYIDPMNESLRAMFKAMKLDPRDPVSWRNIVGMFALIFFPPHRKSGISPKWTPERIKLLALTRSARGLNRPGTKDEDAAKKLMKDKKSPFYGESFEMLRKKLGEAHRKYSALH